MSDPFFSDDFLEDIAGRLEFGSSKIEDKLVEKKPKPFSAGYTRKGGLADLLGLEPYKLDILETNGRSAMLNDKTGMLLHYYRRYLMAVRIYSEEADQAIKSEEDNIVRRKAQYDREQKMKLREFDAHSKRMVESWQKCRESIRIRWNRTRKGLAKMLEKDARLSSIHERDMILVLGLFNLKVLKISEGRVMRVDWDKFDDVSIEDIATILNKMISF